MHQRPDGLQVLRARQLRRALRERQLRDPVQVLLRPVRALIAQVASQQELAEAMARPREVLADVLARADKVAQRFLLFGRHAHERQAAGGELAREDLGVPLIGFDAIRRLRGISPGAQTRMSIPRSRACRASVIPVGPAS
jgi:ABC-type phosphate/phosphonate transport system ATPase subunit